MGRVICDTERAGPDMERVSRDTTSVSRDRNRVVPDNTSVTPQHHLCNRPKSHVHSLSKLSSFKPSTHDLRLDSRLVFFLIDIFPHTCTCTPHCSKMESDVY